MTRRSSGSSRLANRASSGLGSRFAGPVCRGGAAGTELLAGTMAAVTEKRRPVTSTPSFLKRDCQTQSATSDAIVFYVPNGVYAYSVTSPSGFEASPSSGSVTVHFASMNQQVTFASTGSGGVSPVGLAITLAIVLAVVVLAIAIYVRNR